MRRWGFALIFLLACTLAQPPKTWTLEELQARQAKEQAPVWADGDELTFFYQGRADSVAVCCGIQDSLGRLPGTDAWVLTLRVENLEQAVISYVFWPTRDGQVNRDQGFKVWRGPKAPPAPERAGVLSGTLQTHTLASSALGENRTLSVYVPPGYNRERPGPVIYLADGQGTESYARLLEPLVRQGRVPPILLVGVHSGEGSQRTEEYLPLAASPRFGQHERFFTEEVRGWAERTLGATSSRSQRAVFGYSNGGVFTAWLIARHDDLYGVFFPFSMGVPVIVLSWKSSPPRVYATAGTLESGFFTTTLAFADSLRSRGAEIVFKPRVSGHDFVMWEEEFVNAVLWAFGSGR